MTWRVVSVMLAAALLCSCSARPFGAVTEQLAAPALEGEVRSVDLMADAPEGVTAVAIVCWGATAALVQQRLGSEVAQHVTPEAPGFLAAVLYLKDGAVVGSHELGRGIESSDWIFVPCEQRGSFSRSVTKLELGQTQIDLVFVDDAFHPRWYLASPTG